MLKIGSLLVLMACINVVNLRPCEQCEPSIDTASVVKRMEPILTRDQDMCILVTVYSGTNIKRSPDVESILAFGDKRASFTASTSALVNIRVGYDIIPIEKFGKYVGIKIPKLPPLPIEVIKTILNKVIQDRSRDRGRNHHVDLRMTLPILRRENNR